MFFGEGAGAADMVGMFVGEKQGGDLLRLPPDMFQAFFEDARSDADVDQYARLLAFDIDGVAFTATGEYRKLKNNLFLSMCHPEPVEGRHKGLIVLDLCFLQCAAVIDVNRFPFGKNFERRGARFAVAVAGALGAAEW